MAPKYTLHYFNITALGEPIRFLLAYGEADWEDKRQSHEDWAKVKSTTPLGRLPVLEVDGKKLHQSSAICRFLAAKFGLSGKNEIENVNIDIAVDSYRDLARAIAGWYYDTIEASKTPKFEPLMKTTIPLVLGMLSETATKNGGYLANGKLSWADLFFVGSLKYYNTLAGFDLLEKYPVLTELQKKVESIPQIAAYIKKRPATEPLIVMKMWIK